MEQMFFEHDAGILDRMLKDHGIEATDKHMVMFDAWMFSKEGEWKSLDSFVCGEELEQFVKHGLLEVGYDDGALCARVPADVRLEYILHLAVPNEE